MGYKPGVASSAGRGGQGFGGTGKLGCRLAGGQPGRGTGRAARGRSQQLLVSESASPAESEHQPLLGALLLSEELLGPLLLVVGSLAFL